MSYANTKLALRLTLKRADSAFLQDVLSDALTDALRQRTECLRDSPAWLEWSARMDRLHLLYQAAVAAHYDALRAAE